MSEYEGMRWLKCDFQVQTPEDGANWSDADTKLPDPRLPAAAFNVRDETRLQEIARTYLRRCHDAGLEVIGVTDHNFSGKADHREWFLTHLVEQNKSVAKELGRAPLFIMPGFEVDIGYHMLCLFDPAKKASHVRRVHMILARLGLGEQQRFRGGRPEPLRFAGENVSLKKLLEIVQGEHDGICIAAHADQNDGILSQPRNIADYKLRDLYAVEVTANPPARKYLEIVTGKNAEWSRQSRHPACVMSSDAKSLRVDASGKPLPNSLGYRYTWVKMSTPSTASLRQAFLDPTSRVRLLGARPSDSQTHPRIKSVSVLNAKFLADQSISFSENLNCIIGGRGSGKSSVLEYLRFALEVEPKQLGGNQHVDRKREQLLASLRDTGGVVRIDFEAGAGVRDTLIYAPGAGERVRWIEGREVQDLSTVIRQLNAQFFSQGELSRLTSEEAGQQQIRELLESASGPALNQLQVEERDLHVSVKKLFDARRDEARLQQEVRVLQQEVVELSRQLQARVSVQSEAMRNQAAQSAAKFLQDLQIRFDQDRIELSQVAKRFELGINVPAHAEQWPEPDAVSTIVAAVDSAREKLAQSLSRASQEFERALASALAGDEATLLKDAIATTQLRFRTSCSEMGIQPEEVLRLEELQNSRQEKLSQIAVREQQLNDVTTNSAGLSGALATLHQNWRRQYELRRATAEEIEGSVTSQTIRIAVEFMGDKSSFRTLWLRLAPRDGRGKLARRWEELGDDVFNTWKRRGTESTPWETVEAGRIDSHAIPYFYGEMMEDLQPHLLRYIDSSDVLPVWESLRATPVKDAVDVELRRDDGSVAGSMLGSLSEGQRNTVLLNLMLARGTGPIIIDQPEDELDSNFIYKALVHDLRVTKDKRQLIVVTHNANLPVNADAEVIYALEAREGRGRLLAQGGLDRGPVTRAVLEIMEGSEEAFRRRSDKYHF